MNAHPVTPTPDFPGRPPGIKPVTFNLLVESAITLMQQSGCAPSVAEVATHAGVSRATAYRCFPSKGAMLSIMVSQSLGPMRTFASEHVGGKDRVMDLLTRSFPRLSKHEATLRTAVQISLEQQALSKAGLLKETPYRRGHRIQIIDKALEPLKSQLPQDIYSQLHKSLSVVYGVEIFIVLKDIWNEKNKHVLDTMLWMADALIEAALAQAKERKKAQFKQKD
jgi:AcrR family transcriptional regulator